MSDDSSSDDEPMISSPDTSENESDSDSVFKYHAVKFQKSNIKSSSSSSPTKRRKKERTSLEDKLDLMEHQKMMKLNKMKKRFLDKTLATELSDDDSIESLQNEKNDSEKKNDKQELPTKNKSVEDNNNNKSDSDSDSSFIEVIEPPKNVRPCRRKTSKRKQQSIAVMFGGRVTRSAARKAAAQASIPVSQPQNNEVMEILDDSSDDDSATEMGSSLVGLSGASKEAMEAIRRSRLARTSLKSAQNYHAEDIHVEVEEDTMIHSKFVPSIVIDSPPTKDLGKKLRFTCRTKLQFNGKNQGTIEKTLTLRENERLQTLHDKLIKVYDLLPSAHVVMNFDGMTLVMSRTPKSYEMEYDDLIDVVAKTFAVPLQTKNSNIGSTSTGPKLMLKLRRKVGKKIEEKVLKLGMQEPFHILMDAYKKTINEDGPLSFRFDCDSLDLNKTPAHYDMESEDLVDVV